MSAFSIDTGRQTTPPLVDGVVHNRLVQFAPRGYRNRITSVDVTERGRDVRCVFTIIATSRTSADHT